MLSVHPTARFISEGSVVDSRDMRLRYRPLKLSLPRSCVCEEGYDSGVNSSGDTYLRDILG